MKSTFTLNMYTVLFCCRVENCIMFSSISSDSLLDYESFQFSTSTPQISDTKRCRSGTPNGKYLPLNKKIKSQLCADVDPLRYSAGIHCRDPVRPEGIGSGLTSALWSTPAGRRGCLAVHTGGWGGLKELCVLVQFPLPHTEHLCPSFHQVPVVIDRSLSNAGYCRPIKRKDARAGQGFYLLSYRELIYLKPERLQKLLPKASEYTVQKC